MQKNIYAETKQLRFHRENFKFGTCSLNSLITYRYPELAGTDAEKYILQTKISLCTNF